MKSRRTFVTFLRVIKICGVGKRKMNGKSIIVINKKVVADCLLIFFLSL